MIFLHFSNNYQTFSRNNKNKTKTTLTLLTRGPYLAVEQREGAAPLLCPRPRAAAMGRPAGGASGAGPTRRASTLAASAGARAGAA